MAIGTPTRQGSTNGVGTVSVVVTVAISAGAQCYLAYTYDTAGTDVITDNLLQTWVLVFDSGINGFGGGVKVYYLANNTGSLTTVTVTFGNAQSGAASGQAIVDSDTGMLTASALDKTASNTGTSTSASSGATTATTQAAELAYAATLALGGGSVTITPTGGYTQVGAKITNANNVNLGTAYNILSTTGTQTATATLGASSGWCEGVGTFKGATAGGGGRELGLLGVGT